LEGTGSSDQAAWYDALANVLMARVEFGDAASDIDEQLNEVEGEDQRRNALAFIARDHWLRGKLFALRTQHESALESFGKATAQYQDLNNDDAAVRIGIDAVASLIALQQYDDAMTTCRTLVEWSVRVDQQEPTRRRTLTAHVTSYMRELAQMYALTADVVADLRWYIFKITHQRPIPFVPPLPLSTV